MMKRFNGWPYGHLEINVLYCQDSEVGFGRPCVGISVNGSYPDYEWTETDLSFERIDNNGEVWCPEDAYHKHPCIAVLGTGEKAEAQLYEWLKWFDDNDFKVEVSINESMQGVTDPIMLIMGRHQNKRMVKQRT